MIGPEAWLISPEVWLIGPVAWLIDLEAWLIGPEAWLIGPGPIKLQFETWFFGKLLEDIYFGIDLPIDFSLNLTIGVKEKLSVSQGE